MPNGESMKPYEFTDDEVDEMVEDLSGERCPVDDALIDYHNDDMLRRHFKMAVAKRIPGRTSWFAVGMLVTVIIFSVLVLLTDQ